MSKITNHDLHIMLVGMDKDIKSIIEKADLSAKWQKEHEEEDEARFANLNRYATSIAIVASGVGACATWVWSKVTGQT